MKNFTFLLFVTIILASCYNYDGPTRAKKTPPTPPTPRVLNVKQTLSSQDYLKRMAGDIKRSLPSAQVTILEDSIKVLFPDNIKYDKSSILPIKSINQEIKKLARLIKKYTKTSVLVTGHTDKSGKEEINKRLSGLRAGYIKDLLLAYKAPKDRINSWGLGSSSPVSSERVNGGSDNNRRVEFVILSTIKDEEEL